MHMLQHFNIMRMKYWKTSLYVLGVIPLGFIFSLLTFYFHAGKILGHLPSYNHPDPKRLEIYFDYAPFINWSGGMWIYSLIICLILVPIYLIVNRKQVVWTPVIACAIGQSLGMFLLFSDIVEWFAD